MSELHNSDCLSIMAEMPDNSVDAIITDPPYGMSQHSQADIVNALTAWLAGEEYSHGKAGFMGKDWDSFVPSPTIWKQAIRVLKPGGHILCASSTRTVDLMGISLRLAGFEIRDEIIYAYGSGFPKSLDISKAIDKHFKAEREVVGYKRQVKASMFQGGKERKVTLSATLPAKQFEGIGTALKPAHEPFILARKPIEKGLSIAENCLKWGTGGLDIEGCRVATDDDTGRKQTTDTPKFSGKYNNGKDYHTPIGTINGNHEKGRFPANLILDDSECVRELFPKQAGGHSLNTKKVYAHTGKEVTSLNLGPGTPTWHKDKGSAARFFYCAKASQSERNAGLELNKNIHETVKPIALMEYLVRLITREGQIVLDPFMGSGTTGIACVKQNREFIGIELNADYFEIASARIANAKPIAKGLFPE